jgi:MOSC domain
MKIIFSDIDGVLNDRKCGAFGFHLSPMHLTGRKPYTTIMGPYDGKAASGSTVAPSGSMTLNAMPALEGTVVAVSADCKHNFSKRLQREIVLVAGHGVEGDAHAGPYVRHRYLARKQPRLPNLRQVHLIPSELFEFLRTAGYDVSPGELGENITTAGLDLERLPVGAILRLGQTAAVALTGLRTPCVLIDRYRACLRREVIRPDKSGPPFRCGVLGVVTAGGTVSAGDLADVTLPDEPRRVLPSM